MSSTARNLETKKINFTIRSGPHKDEHFSFSKEVISIGRGPENDIPITKDVKASRRHARLHIRNEDIIIENITEKNYVFVNGAVTTSKTLSKGDVILIGESEFHLQWETPQSHNFENVKPLASTNKSVATTSQSLPIAHGPQAVQSSIPPQQHPFPQQQRSPQQSQHLQQNVFPQQNPFSGQNPHPHGFNTQKAQKNIRNKPLNMNFIIAVVVVIVGVIYLLNDKPSSKGKKGLNLRTDDQIKKELEEQRSSIDSYMKSKNITEDGEVEKSLAAAQSYYVKGFRDYRLGQFGRSIQSFQAALSFNPSHVLARKYLTLAIRKQDELVDFNMLQGKRYRDKGNYRLCKSAYQQVMIIRKDATDKKYKEAKQMFDACDTLAKGRY